MSEPNDQAPASEDQREPMPIDSGDTDNDKDLDQLMELVEYGFSRERDRTINDAEILNRKHLLRIKLSAMLELNRAAKSFRVRADEQGLGFLSDGMGLAYGKLCVAVDICDASLLL